MNIHFQFLEMFHLLAIIDSEIYVLKNFKEL